jgi:hypothetical protein
MTYLKRLKRGVPTKRGVRLTFSSGHTAKTIKLSREASGQILQALQIPTKKGTAEVRLTLTVLGHQVVQTPEAKGLLLRTKEWGIIVFSLPQGILQKLTADLAHLASSPPGPAANQEPVTQYPSASLLPVHHCRRKPG